MGRFRPLPATVSFGVQWLAGYAAWLAIRLHPCSSLGERQNCFYVFLNSIDVCFVGLGFFGVFAAGWRVVDQFVQLYGLD